VTALRSVKVFLVGEGSNELGSRAREREHQSDESPGVLHALLRRVAADGWEVGGARQWSKIRKIKLGNAPHADTRNVLGAALHARESRCEVLAFCRDRDNDRGREAAVAKGIERVAGEMAQAGAGHPARGDRRSRVEILVRRRRLTRPGR
jgi:hypothetical protein